MLAEINSRAAFDVIINHTGIDIEVSDTIVIDTRGSESAGSERELWICYPRLSEKMLRC